MVAAVVMDTRAILMATGMETVVTGIVVTVVQGVIGDEIKEQGESLSLIVAFPLQWRHTQPDCPTMIVPSVSPLHHDYDTISKGKGMR
jgi:hypothetical protein